MSAGGCRFRSMGSRGAAAAGRTPALAAWLDDFFDSYYRRRPVNATFTGVHLHDHRLPDLSDEGAGDAAADAETLQARLRSLPPEAYGEADALDRRLAEGYLRIQRWELGSRHFHRGNPSVYTGEAVFGVVGLLLRPFAPFEDRLAPAFARMAVIPAFLRQGRANVRRAPAAWVSRAIRECDGALAFFGDGIDLLLRDRPRGVTPLERRVVDDARAAFAEFRDYLAGDLTARATADYACGGEALALVLREGHCLEDTAGAIAAYAEGRMAACEARLHEQAAAFGARTWREALARLADRHPAADAYYPRFAEVWTAARAAAEAHGLVTWPDAPIRYGPQPAWARGAAPSLYFLAYRSPAPFDHLPVTDYLVPPVDPEMAPGDQARRLREINDSVIKLNHVIHHGGLGHHVQNWYAARAASRIGQVAAVDCASRIAMVCGGTMAEGWACYATDLMEEIGFLDPLERYAQIHARLRMAARALVDVRLHEGAITLDDAAAVYRDRVGMTPAAAHAEAVKNSMFPGAALMYLTGTDGLHALRRTLSARPGFGLRAFHDRVLSFGSIPVALIGSAMRAEGAGAMTPEVG